MRCLFRVKNVDYDFEKMKNKNITTNNLFFNVSASATLLTMNHSYYSLY